MKHRELQWKYMGVGFYLLHTARSSAVPGDDLIITSSSLKIQLSGGIQWKETPKSGRNMLP